MIEEFIADTQGIDLGEIAKTAGIIVGGSIALTASFLGSAIGILKFRDRRYALKQLREDYQAGRLNRKPGFFNVWSFYEPVEKLQGDN